MSVECLIQIMADTSQNGVFTDSQSIKGRIKLAINQPIDVYSVEVKLVSVSNVIYLHNHDGIQDRIRAGDGEITLAEQIIFPLGSLFDHESFGSFRFNQGTYSYLYELPLAHERLCHFCGNKGCHVPTFNELFDIVNFNYYVKVIIHSSSFADGMASFYEAFRYVPLDFGSLSSEISEQAGGVVKRRSFTQYNNLNVGHVIDEVPSLFNNVSLLTPLLTLLESNLTTFFASSSSGASTKSLDVHMFMKATLDRSELCCGKLLPLLLYFGSTQDPYKCDDTDVIFLQGLTIQLLAQTEVLVDTHLGTSEWLSTSHTVELYRIPPQNILFELTSQNPIPLSIEDIPLTTPLGFHVPQLVLSGAMISNYITPSFSSCRIRRKYDLKIQAGFTADEVSSFEDGTELNAKVQNITLEFKDVNVRGGLEHPQFEFLTGGSNY